MENPKICSNIKFGFVLTHPCDYTATQQDYLKKNKMSVHEGVKYQCNQCDLEASYQGDL